MTTKAEYFQDLFHRYQEEHDGLPETPYRVVQWAMDKGLLEPPKIDPVAVHAESMARYLREEYATDPKTGRQYRRNHAVKITTHGVQGYLWAEMERAPREHMVRAFQLRRQGVVGDCAALKNDVDVYNGWHPGKEPIQLVLDFREDIEEIEAARDANKSHPSTDAQPS